MVAASVSLESLCVNSIRMLAVDAVNKSNSGHPGLPMGCAPMGYALWQNILNHNPNNPKSKGIKNPEEEDKNNNTDKTIEDKSRSLRSPILSFANTDMAFRDNVLVAGNYHGFNIYEIDQLGVPKLLLL